MLSKYDIISELGKGINIFPFNEDNLKDNSYNLTAAKTLIILVKVEII